MTRDVLITIRGLQELGNSEEEPLELITSGNYFHKNGKHYILFDEIQEGFGGSTMNRIKISDDAVDVRKKGVSNVHMVFEKDRKNETFYETPFGSLLLGINASDVSLKEEEDNIDVDVKYGLEVNSEFLADCTIHMNIASRKEGNFSL